jgi:hypothetical protein
VGSLLRFLNETLQWQNQLAVDCKYHAGSSTVQFASHLPKTRFQFPNQWHSQRPAELNRFDIFADRPPIAPFKFEPPIANGLSAGSGSEEDDVQSNVFHK